MSGMLTSSSSSVEYSDTLGDSSAVSSSASAFTASKSSSGTSSTVAGVAILQWATTREQPAATAAGGCQVRETVTHRRS